MIMSSWFRSGAFGMLSIAVIFTAIRPIAVAAPIHIPLVIHAPPEPPLPGVWINNSVWWINGPGLGASSDLNFSDTYLDQEIEANLKFLSEYINEDMEVIGTRTQKDLSAATLSLHRDQAGLPPAFIVEFTDMSFMGADGYSLTLSQPVAVQLQLDGFTPIQEQPGMFTALYTGTIQSGSIEYDLNEPMLGIGTRRFTTLDSTYVSIEIVTTVPEPTAIIPITIFLFGLVLTRCRQA